MTRWTRVGLALLALLAGLALIATACGSDTTATTSGPSAGSDDEMSDDEMSDDEMSDDMSDDAMDDGAMGDDAMDHDDDDHHGDEDHGDEHGEHDHAMPLDIAAGSPVPSVTISVDESMQLRVSLENFTITPDNVDGEPVENEGHMHLLVDGVKVDRFTELERDLSDVLEPGMRSVEVELNANDHRPWAVDGERIRDSVMVDVPGVVEEADVAISASYADGTVAIEDDRVEVPLGSEVFIQLTSDVAEELHVHGYDVYGDIDPEAGGQVRFTADIPGSFEVELEQSGTFIVELVVGAS